MAVFLDPKQEYNVVPYPPMREYTAFVTGGNADCVL